MLNIEFLIIKKTWTTWKLVLNKNKDSTFESSQGTSEPSVSLVHQVGLWTRLDSLSLDFSWRRDRDKILYHQVMISIPKNQRSYLAEVRSRQNLLYKGGGTEIVKPQWGKDEWE